MLKYLLEAVISLFQKKTPPNHYQWQPTLEIGASQDYAILSDSNMH
jgi:hypothetical protein